MNRLAIIMSVYKNDRLSFVERAVGSMLRQTYVHFDFYIIADGELEEGVARYLATIDDERVIRESNGQNVGLAKSLNALLRIVLPKGYEYIARMDADDVSMPERLYRQVDFMNRHENVDCVGTWAIEIDEYGRVYYHKQMPTTHEGCRELFKKRDCMIHPTVVFRRSFFDKAGLYPEDTYYAEDTMMWAKGFANGCRFANIPEYLYEFRLDGQFFQRRRGLKHAIEIYRLRKRVNHMLHYPKSTDVYALLYAVAKMMPTPLLNIIYKTFR